jgi:1,4-alpha-glucan branching enzyme
LVPDLTKAPMGGTLVPGGATFRIWAPRAKSVYVSGDFNGWKQDSSCLLNQIGGGHWGGFVSGLNDGDQYLFFVDGIGTSNYKRDPHGRALTFLPVFPGCNCVLRNPARFQWHETGFHPLAFSDSIIYQLHVGTYFIQPESHDGSFLDVITKIPYLANLGVTAIEPMPVSGIRDGVQPRLQRD